MKKTQEGQSTRGIVGTVLNGENPFKLKATRETIESVVIAVILAFLFRGFEAEAFVIPTGSMAPTLQGRHVDVECEQCHYRYRTGASDENEDRMTGLVAMTQCPICGYYMRLKRSDDPNYRGETDENHRSFTGDRIIVSKFAYQFSEPQRWDIIVFKYPGNAKQNYIKRLIGLPGETIMIKHGDIYVKAAGESEFKIARKPPYKATSMLQLVDDTNYIGSQLVDVGWPSRWQEWSRPLDARQWQVELAPNQAFFTIAGDSDETRWLRYRHLVPDFYDWQFIEKGILPRDSDDSEQPEAVTERKGQLISDYYTYNAKGFSTSDPNFGSSSNPRFEGVALQLSAGMHWVGDLGVVCDVDVESASGELLLDLVEGGVHFQCSIDISDGAARLSASHGVNWLADESPVGETALDGPGKYQIRYANVDNELFLWVDNQLVRFDAPSTDNRATFDPRDNDVPRWSPRDPGDAEPVGIGSRGARLKVTRLQVLRDIYYVAVTENQPPDRQFDYNPPVDATQIQDVFGDPESWARTNLFSARRTIDDFVLEEDQFFPLGDNSPASKDGRLWTGDRFVKREFLTGKALFIYWPHPWNNPFWPNFKRMGFIR